MAGDAREEDNGTLTMPLPLFPHHEVCCAPAHEMDCHRPHHTAPPYTEAEKPLAKERILSLRAECLGYF